MTEIMATTYERLAAPFEGTFHDVRGGVELEYITGEQCVSRLNEVLGPGGWTFTVLEHGYNQEADEYWVLGNLNVYYQEGDRDYQMARQQFGSQKVKRSRGTDKPLDIGFDLKGATTDALKKCASLVGVGLYLSRKEAPAERAEGVKGSTLASAQADKKLLCTVCEKPLTETKFQDGKVTSPAQLANWGERKHGRVLCMEHYVQANKELKAREAQVAASSEVREEVPF